MPRKQLTEEQKAQTVYTDILLEDADNEDSPLADIALILQRFVTLYKFSDRNACVALRDYAQLLVARHRDASLAESQARIRELESLIEMKETK